MSFINAAYHTKMLKSALQHLILISESWSKESEWEDHYALYEHKSNIWTV